MKSIVNYLKYKRKYVGRVEKDGQIYLKYTKVSRFRPRYIFSIFVFIVFLSFAVMLVHFSYEIIKEAGIFFKAN